MSLTINVATQGHIIFFLLLLISLIFHAVTDYFHFSGGDINYLNATEDETIEFGTPKVDIENYPSNYAERWILIVPEGRNVQIYFDIFELEDSEGCKNDYVEFREASTVAGSSNGDIGPILTGRLCGNTKPNSILSQGNMVWVQFLSDSNSTTVNKGFKASFKAGVLYRGVFFMSIFSNAARRFFFYIFSFGKKSSFNS